MIRKWILYTFVGTNPWLCLSLMKGQASKVSFWNSKLASLHHQLSFFLIDLFFWFYLISLFLFSRWLDKEEIRDPRDCTTRCGRQKNFGQETRSLNWVGIPCSLLLVQKYYLEDQATPVSFHKGSMEIILCRAKGSY